MSDRHHPDALLLGGSASGEYQKEINMNKTRLILGVICLVIAVALAVLNLTLSPDKIWFNIGYGNMPWAPPIIFGIIGILLLATASMGIEGQATPVAQPRPEVNQDPEKTALNKRLESMAWGCFLILWAGSMFWPKIMPGNQLPEGLWSIGVGLILLGLNAARYFSKIRMSGFTTVLGVISILGGVVQLFGVKNLEGAFLLLILGAYLIVKPWFEKRKLFGKAEAE
jgi:hypothetical protein